MSGNAARNREKPYLTGDAALDPKWTRKAWALYGDEKLRLSLDGHRAQLSGECPRCEHPMSGVYPIAVHVDRLGPDLDRWAGGDRIGRFGGGGGRFEDTLAPLPDEVEAGKQLELAFTCTCSQPHPGKPVGTASGCGVSFSFFVTVP